MPAIKMRIIVSCICVLAGCLIALTASLIVSHYIWLSREKQRLDRVGRELDEDLERDKKDFKELEKRIQQEREDRK
jgi:hypothetical protein